MEAVKPKAELVLNRRQERTVPTDFQNATYPVTTKSRLTKKATNLNSGPLREGPMGIIKIKI